MAAEQQKEVMSMNPWAFFIALLIVIIIATIAMQRIKVTYQKPQQA